jgi:hypothetical protein
MALPVFSTLSKPTAAQFNSLLPIFVVKGVDEAAISDIVLSNDAELFVSVSASMTYEVRSHIIYDSATAADMQIAWTAPAGATFQWNSHGGSGTAINADTVNFETRTLAQSANVGGYGVGTQAVVCPSGLLVVAGTAGTFRMQWAQVVSTASNTTVRAGSHLILRRVA